MQIQPIDLLTKRSQRDSQGGSVMEPWVLRNARCVAWRLNLQKDQKGPLANIFGLFEDFW